MKNISVRILQQIYLLYRLSDEKHFVTKKDPIFVPNCKNVLGHLHFAAFSLLYYGDK